MKSITSRLIGAFLGLFFSSFYIKYQVSKNLKLLTQQNLYFKSDNPVNNSQLLINDELAYVEYDTLLVGVLSCKKYITTRAIAIHQTWGNLAKRIYYFADYDESEITPENNSVLETMKIITLPNVNDNIYPPQKKMFEMLKYFCENHLNEYKFFLRADDDVYIDIPSLTQFLNTIDSNRLIYMGQPGLGWFGHREELGLNGHNFCMGGPGVILSRAAMLDLCPKLDDCVNEVVSKEEDVELGRCVRKYVGIECTHSWEALSKFYHAYDGDFRGESPFMDTNLDENEHVNGAYTLHHVKQPWIMFKLHRHFLKRSLKKEELMHKMLELKSSVNSENSNGFDDTFNVTDVLEDLETCVDQPIMTFTKNQLFNQNGEIENLESSPIVNEIRQAGEVAYDNVLEKLVLEQYERLKFVQNSDNVSVKYLRKNLVLTRTSGYIIQRKAVNGNSDVAYVYTFDFTNIVNGDVFTKRVRVSK